MSAGAIGNSYSTPAPPPVTGVGSGSRRPRPPCPRRPVDNDWEPSALFGPAAEGLVPEIVPDEFLERANGYLGTAANIGMIVGPVAGGILTAAGLAGVGLAFDSLSFRGGTKSFRHPLIGEVTLPFENLHVDAVSGLWALPHTPGPAATRRPVPDDLSLIVFDDTTHTGRCRVRPALEQRTAPVVCRRPVTTAAGVIRNSEGEPCLLSSPLSFTLSRAAAPS